MRFDTIATAQTESIGHIMNSQVNYLLSTKIGWDLQVYFIYFFLFCDCSCDQNDENDDLFL